MPHATPCRAEERDTVTLRESEKDMLRFFGKKKIEELDKRCLLINVVEAKVHDEAQYMLFRRGQIVKLKFIGDRASAPGAFIMAE